MGLDAKKRFYLKLYLSIDLDQGNYDGSGIFHIATQIVPN
jgi:hypothetical protein